MNGQQITVMASRRRLVMLLAVSVLATQAVAAWTGPASARDALDARAATSKPGHTSIERGSSRTDVQLKFVEGSAVSVRGQTFESSVVDVAPVNGLMTSMRGIRVTPMTTMPPAQLRQEKADLEQRTGRELADLSLYFDVTLPRVTSRASAERFIDSLNALPTVELAAPEPRATAPTTPDLSRYQGYRFAAPGGVGATTSGGVLGARGNYVQVADIEWNWNTAHEDLSDARASGAFIPNRTPVNSTLSQTNHGTAVIGELSGDDNGLGVTGLVPNARLRLVNVVNQEQGFDLVNALAVATTALGAGDVVLIEVQIAGPNYNTCSPTDCGWAPVEYNQAYYDAITTATAKGIIVVEPAGNGYENLNGTEYSPMNTRDSGAIIVGAGAAPTNDCGSSWTRPARSRLDFSNYGSFVDVQGWGQCVTSTGYGDAQNTSANTRYTYGFSGTSSASPIVAGAAAAYSSAVEAFNGTHPTSKQVRSVLASTGTPQDTTSAGVLSGKIGPLPNVHKALATFTSETGRPTVVPPVQSIVNKKQVGSSVQVKVAWSATDPSGIASYQLWVSTNGGTFVRDTSLSSTATTVTYSLSVGKSYQFFVRASDTWGNSSTDAGGYGPKFTPTVTDDRSTDISYYAAPSVASSWAYKSYAQGYNQTVTKSTVAGEFARYTFTGRDVAFVASIGTNRGYADVFIDGAFYSRVKLYGSVAVGATIVVTKHWSTSGSHTIDVQTAAVDGYPTAIDVDAFVVNK